MCRLKLVSCVNLASNVRHIQYRLRPSSSRVNLGIPIITQYHSWTEERSPVLMDSTAVSHGPKACGSQHVVSTESRLRQTH